MGAVTWFPRILPFWLLSKKTIPSWVTLWLSYVPASVLAAMLAPELLVRSHRIDVALSNTYLWLALPTFAVGALTKNIFLTVVVGMGGLAAIRFFFGAGY